MKMKKVVVLLTVASLLAAPAFAAGIRNSKHDLSTSAGTSYASDNTDELCVFCHTPHAGAVGESAPLWNRTLGTSLTFVAGDLYNSATLEFNSQPAQVVNAVNQSDAKLCLSCHDGGSLATGLLNPPASNGNIDPTFTSPSKSAISGDADLFDNTGSKNNALENDHPIGMTYTDAAIGVAAGGDAELNFDGNADFADAANGKLPLYSGTDGVNPYTSVLWCSTCHDVHNPDKGTPFLNMTNDGSAMCLTCHNK